MISTWGHSAVNSRSSCGEDLRADALVRADPQRAGLAGVERGEIGLRGLEARGDRVGVAEEQLARLGQRDGPRAARAVDQLLADDPLEHRDLLADRRLRVAELLGGAAERALLGDRLQGDQMAELEPEPADQFP